jgi:hypothetical protein
LARCKNSSITISADGRNITYKSLGGRQSVFAEKGFDISAGFSGPVLYYFEVISIPPSQW